MIKMLKSFRIKDYILIIICALLVIAQVWLELKMPDYMSSITVLIQTSGSTLSEILKQGILMLACAFGSLISSIIVGFLAANLSASFSKNIRKRIFDKVTDFGMEEIKKFKTSSLITRTTNDVTQLEMIISMGLQMTIKSPIMAIWAILKIVNKSFEWSMLTAGCVVVLLATVFGVMLVVLPRFERVQKLIDKVNGVTRENLTGIRVIRAFNAEAYQEKRFDSVNEELTNTLLFNQKAFALFGPVMNLVMYSLTLGIYVIGAYLISSATIYDKITIFSNMIVFTSYGMQVILSFLMLAFIFMMVPRCRVSIKRINEVLDEKISIIDGTFDKETTTIGEVEFKNVSFKYPDADEYLLENISFKVNRGETVAFIGSTGSGKSTLINLIPRFYDATDGSILVDGVDVKEYKMSNLHNKIGYIPQKPIMFNKTVMQNVGYGQNDKEMTEETIKEAIRVAQAKDFVEKMDESYSSHIAFGGTNISGGQKQRLSISRAIARNPEIYIFDDSFSALDYKTDLKLRQELKKYTKDSTIIIVAQRIGTIINADKIIVLDKGKCVGIGTHKELLKNCDIYKEIALSQLSKEELQNA